MAGQRLAAALEEAQAEGLSGNIRPSLPAPKRSRRLSEAERGELAQDYQRGMTVYELASKYSISRQTVSVHLHRMGIPMRRQGLTDTQVAKATELYEQGLNLRQVGTKLGIQASTLRLAMKEAGVKLRAPAAERWDQN
ncbi:hypothetical protein [Nocardia salmonicida]|uniref:hypothetical protein n=1 Tax=Nocardia salmonicida TaxID=53431 RepID=UPI0033DAE379